MHALEIVDLGKGRGAHFLAVPGILARSQEQLEPLLPLLNTYNLYVTGFNFAGTHFDAGHAVHEIAATVRRNLTMSQQTILFGSSLGGMLAAQVLAELRKEYDQDHLRTMVPTIFVDSPSSSQDLILAPPLSGGLNPTIGKMVRRFKPSTDANSGYGKKLLATFRVPPKDGEIELEDGGLTAEEIKQRAVQGLSGHAFTVWFDQLRWMLNTTLDLEPLEGLNTTYLACTKGNMTVRQPQAQHTWEPYVTDVVEVETPHCAYLQAQGTWTRTLDRVLSSMDLARP